MTRLLTIAAVLLLSIRVDGVAVTDFHSFISRSYVFDRIYTFTLRDTQGRPKEVRSTMPLLRKQ